MQVAIILVHNLSDIQNAAQIDSVSQYVVKNTQTFIDEVSGEKNIIRYYTISGLTTIHQCKFYQAVPYGVTDPPNLSLLDSHNVYFRTGDEDKSGDHCRFFNWGVKRATDQGAEIVVYITDATKFVPKDLQKAIDNFAKKDYAEAPFGIITSGQLQKKFGQLDESGSLTTELPKLKGAL